MFIWKYENIAMFPTAVILKKHVENPRVFFFFFRLLKLFHICHSLFQEQLILNAKGMKNKYFT